MKTTACLRGYKNGRAYILIEKEITGNYTLADFQDIRINYMERLKFDFDRFETNLRKNGVFIY